MILYSDTILVFNKRCHNYAREILSTEMNINVRRTRFLYKKYLYPIQVVVFEKQNLLGFFNFEAYQIGIHKHLMYTAKEKVLKDIIRHELAHYLCFLDYGITEHVHGSEFKEVCSRFKWDSSISKASVDIQEFNNVIEGDLESERIISKVKKLLQLADSANQHESELATLKANQLLLKHNLRYVQENSDDDEILYVCKVIEQKRRDAKMQAIYDILRFFLVRPVFNFGHKKVYLEITGTKTNVSLAQYVSDFLSHELDRLWQVARGASPELRGIKSKNSFFVGLSSGYSSKMNSSIDQYPPGEKMSLIKIEKDLDTKIRKFYRSLSSTSMSSSLDSRAHSEGLKAGKKLNINKGVSSNSPTFLLTR